ncbi:MAG: glutamate 5-kinase, partial [Oscillospiraceae bacterium]|nr:glutamate 5-kinase [Oscillospiraceae bacterium]
STLSRLLELAAIPIINENDTVATEEIAVGDNDTLSAIVAVSTHADLLILLSDIDGLYTADPHKNADATLIAEVDHLTDAMLDMAGGSAGEQGTGGMRTKLLAARMVTENGIDMVIANGAQPALLYAIIEGRSAGTRFKAKKA